MIPTSWFVFVPIIALTIAVLFPHLPFYLLLGLVRFFGIDYVNFGYKLLYKFYAYYRQRWEHQLAAIEAKQKQLKEDARNLQVSIRYIDKQVAQRKKQQEKHIAAMEQKLEVFMERDD